MKTDLKAKFLQHFVTKRENEGFTLIELLVVIIIIGILSAIALPSFLNQANKAKQSEAKTYVGSMNRGQQAYYLENSEFTDSVDQTGIGVATETENYRYSAALVTAITGVQNDGLSLKDPLRSYAGVVWLDTITETSEATTLGILCENESPGQAAIPATTTAGDCPAGMEQVN